ncbi:MAG: mechanosensitive ion channel [Phycisphaerales bacterium]|nr:mechanosensitive ion channel [Phycisphaerales bacterium]
MASGIRRIWLAVAGALALVLGGAPVLGQDAAPTTDSVAALMAEIQDALRAAGDDPAVATDSATEPIKALRAARDSASAAAASLASAADFAAKASSAPETMAQVQAELNKPAEVFTPTYPDGATAADLDKELKQAEADLKAAREEQERILAEFPRRNDRLKEIPNEIAALTGRIDSLHQQLAIAPTPEQDATLVSAQRLRTRAELAASQARLAELQAESASYEVRRDLLPARRDRAARKVAALEQRFNAWQAVVSELRTREAKHAADQASEKQLAQADAIPALQPIADDIRKLAKLLKGPGTAPAELPRATADLADRTKKLDDLTKLQSAVERRVETGRLDSSQGQFLRRQLNRINALGASRQLHAQLEEYRDQSLRTQLTLVELEELERETSDVERALGEIRGDLGAGADPGVIELATSLLSQRKTLVNQALGVYQPYADTLDALVSAYTQAVDRSDKARAFINERVFWVRSVSGSLAPSPGELVEEAAWALSAKEWVAASAAATDAMYPALARREAAAGTADTPSFLRLTLAPAAAGFLLFLAWVGHWRLARRSALALPKTGHVTQLNMAGAVWKLAVAVAAAAPIPLALWLISRWLEHAAAPTTGPAAVATGVARAAYVLFGLNLLREFSRPGAVGAEHFRWPEAGQAHLRRNLHWFTPLAVVVGLVVQAYNYRSTETGQSDGIGRIAFVAGMLAVAVFYHRVFSPKRPLISEYLKKRRGGLIEKTKWAWFPVLTALPVLLALATAAGYASTALQIQRRLADTFVFVLVVIVANALVLRYFQLARRKLAIQAAKARAAAAAAAAEGGEAKEAAPEIDTSSELDLTALSLQTRKVLQALVTVVLILGLYGVWSDVLPALRWFERVQILPHLAYVNPDTGAISTLTPGLPTDAPAPNGAVGNGAGNGMGNGAGGGAGGSAPSAGLPSSPLMSVGQGGASGGESAGVRAPSVTLADLGLAVLLVMLTVSASKNVPGLLEITVLQRLPLGAAGRYAIYTVARYLIVIVGIVVISQALSVPWEKAQWLAAALTFGLAFGLQEIFANFVSGLIILFEQPIRLGDTVTVGGSSGTVTKIRMRATTITDWDRKELVIPNKTFITDQITNWTLSDPVCRVVVPVGIAYGSDTEQAQRLLLQLAKETPHALEDPPARALFLGFGDNTLNFELRVFIDSLENLITAKSELHFRIDRAFREAGLEIAFPQRDLHVRSIDAGVVESLSGLRGPTRTTEAGSS